MLGYRLGGVVVVGLGDGTTEAPSSPCARGGGVYWSLRPAPWRSGAGPPLAVTAQTARGFLLFKIIFFVSNKPPYSLFTF
jgi:hypothetical protein